MDQFLPQTNQWTNKVFLASTEILGGALDDMSSGMCHLKFLSVQQKMYLLGKQICS